MMRMFGSGAVGRKSLLPNFKELKEPLHDLAGFRDGVNRPDTHDRAVELLEFGVAFFARGRDRCFNSFVEAFGRVIRGVDTVFIAGKPDLGECFFRGFEFSLQRAYLFHQRKRAALFGNLWRKFLLDSVFEVGVIFSFRLCLFFRVSDEACKRLALFVAENLSLRLNVFHRKRWFPLPSHNRIPICSVRRMARFRLGPNYSSRPFSAFWLKREEKWRLFRREL